MEGTRLRILQLLQKNTHDTVDGLTKAIHLAPATIRRHLDILQRDRLVAFREVRKKTGRPEYSFYLTEDGHEALPKNYDRLLSMMIQELTAMTPEDTTGHGGAEILDLIFLRMSERVWGTYQGRVAGKDLGFRLNTLMGLLKEEDFFPAAEMVGGELRIRLLNCPFRLTALQTKAVCSFDGNLISDMLNVDVVREECIHDDDAGCLYTAQIGATEASELSSSL